MSSTYVIDVLVVNKDGKGVSGHQVKRYGGVAVKTNSQGKATVIADASSVTIYVDGSQVYDGSSSKAPKPIVVRKN